MNDAATTQMRGAMEIAAQSVVAYLPIVRHVPLRPDALARRDVVSQPRVVRGVGVLGVIGVEQ